MADPAEPAAASVSPPKYPHGKHPNSLANLRKPWQPGESGNGTHTGPLITPALRKFALLDPVEFFRVEPKNVAEVVAAAYLIEAMQTGFDKARSEVINRLDGPLSRDEKIEISIAWLETQRAIARLIS